MPVAIFAALVLASLLLILWLAQERIVFQPPRNFDATQPPFAKRIEYKAFDGQPLVGFFIGSAIPSTGLLVCFHGNADLAAWQLEWGREVALRSGHSVFLAEYRGYYGLRGKPTYRTSALDADAAYGSALAEAGVPAGRVSFFGHSLGSAVASELSLRCPARKLLLQSPFTSAKAMGRLVIGRPLLLLWSRLSRVHFDTERIVASIDTPVSVIHGARDRIVPVRMGKSVYAAARSKGILLILPEAGHNDIPDAGGDEYWNWLTRSLL